MKIIISLIVLGMFLLAGTQSVAGASWSSYVLEVNGTGIDTVNVTAVLASNNNYENSTLTNSNGFFNLKITNLKSVKLISSKSGYLTDTSQSLPAIFIDITLPFNITLEEAFPGNITGRVANTTGAGVENADVSVIQGTSTIKSVLSDSNGDYLLADLLDGTYTIEANALGYVIQNVTNSILSPNSTISVNFSLTPETVPPIISSISATLITSSEAVIIWQTDEDANSNVYYRKANAPVLTLGSSTFTNSHLIRLSSLSSNTLYYYNVSSCDFAGNCNTSGEFSFTTSAAVVVSEEGSIGGGAGGSAGAGGVVSALPTMTRILSEGARVAIKMEGETHYLEIIELTNTSIVINISSTPQQATLNIGEEKKFEITDDDYYDILVKLNNINDNRANITIINIHEEILKIPIQLLDINFNLVNSLIQDVSELVAIVGFENFGTEPIRVNFLFTILDGESREVYTEDGSIMVDTEKILRKQFDETSLEKGKYTLILTTLYNVDFVDEFRQEFEILKEGRLGITGRTIEFFGGAVGGLYWLLVFGVMVLIGLTLYFLIKFWGDMEK